MMVRIDGVRSCDMFLRVRRLRYSSDIWRGIEQTYEARARCHSNNIGDLSHCVCQCLVSTDSVGAVEQARRCRRDIQCFCTGLSRTNYIQSYPIFIVKCCSGNLQRPKRRFKVQFSCQ